MGYINLVINSPAEFNRKILLITFVIVNIWSISFCIKICIFTWLYLKVNIAQRKGVISHNRVRGNVCASVWINNPAAMPPPWGTPLVIRAWRYPE